MYKCNYTCVNYLNHLATTSVCQMYSPCTICINTSSVLALYYLYNYWPAWCESGVQMLNPFNYRSTTFVTNCAKVYYLNHLASLVRASPPVLKSPFLTISNLVIEPVPLFNRSER